MLNVLKTACPELLPVIIGEIESEKCSMRSLVVGVGDGAILLLAGRILQLQHDVSLVNPHLLGLELRC